MLKFIINQSHEQKFVTDSDWCEFTIGFAQPVQGYQIYTSNLHWMTGRLMAPIFLTKVFMPCTKCTMADSQTSNILLAVWAWGGPAPAPGNNVIAPVCS